MRANAWVMLRTERPVGELRKFDIVPKGLVKKHPFNWELYTKVPKPELFTGALKRYNPVTYIALTTIYGGARPGRVTC